MATDTFVSEALGVSAARSHTALLEQAATRFAADTTEHSLRVLHDEGLHRHLRFRKPGTATYWFDLVTWPGVLVINGDMGTYVFSRLEDMFDFFRSGPGINPEYWAEKLRADSDVKAFSADRLRELVADVVAEWVEDLRTEGAEQSTVDALLAAVRDEVLTGVEDERSVRDALDSFRHEGREFVDTWEWDLREYTHHFLWCCHAIRWGIAQYDAASLQAVEAPAA